MDPPKGVTARETLARQISEVRKRQRLTKQELADRAGLDRLAIYRIENEQRGVQLDELHAIAAALSVAPINLVVPRGEFDHLDVNGTPVISHQARDWWRGFRPVEGYPYLAEGSGEELWRVPALPDQQEHWFYAEASDDERHAFRMRGVRELLADCLSLVWAAARLEQGDGYVTREGIEQHFRLIARDAAHYADQLAARQEGIE